nr:MAG TPA: hypothetical protein [Siphoviridae sp. ctweK11]
MLYNNLHSSSCLNSPHSRIFYFYILCSNKRF